MPPNLVLSDSAFEDFITDKDIKANLSRLRKSKDRLATFYIGKISEVTPCLKHKWDPQDRWIFYTAFGQLSSNSGIVMIRHNVYPYAIYKDDVPIDNDRIAVCWKIADETELKRRLNDENFQGCFKEYDHFSYIQVRSSKDFEFDLIPRKSPVTEKLEALRIKSLENYAPVPTQFDVAIVTALSEELEAVKCRLRKIDKNCIKKKGGS